MFNEQQLIEEVYQMATKQQIFEVDLLAMVLRNRKSGPTDSSIIQLEIRTSYRIVAASAKQARRLAVAAILHEINSMSISDPLLEFDELPIQIDYIDIIDVFEFYGLLNQDDILLLRKESIMKVLENRSTFDNLWFYGTQQQISIRQVLRGEYEGSYITVYT